MTTEQHHDTIKFLSGSSIRPTAKIMKQHELKQLRSDLKFGDVTTIANEVGCSTATVQAALRGTAMTDTAKMVIAHAQKLVQQRAERIEYLKSVIKPLYKRTDD